MKEKLNLVHIIDDYYMAADGTQFVLVKRVERTNRKTNEGYADEETLGYFVTVSGLLKHLAKNHISDEVQSGNIKTIKELIREYDAITSRLEECVSY